MKKYISILQRSQLFAGVGEADIEAMLDCLSANLRDYKKGEYVLREGERVDNVMLLASGSLNIQKDDFWGNRSIVNHISAGEMFGEAYIAPESGPILNDVIALEDSVVMFFDFRKILTVCSSACKFHTTVIQNLFFAISEKNRQLVQKLGHMSKRTTRDKLISYLSEQAKRGGSSTFSIPFNRQQLADFLCVDRSAMSNELCKMRDEGLLTFERSRFTLISRINEI
ncbi:MAG TPA: Crp/Fnr family transcriptional regulator [Firmicutes bacterium]|nr:Crp/Fnr family transcriptional regulator [Bacillota bacterium]